MEETAAGAENPEHAIQLPEIGESDSLPRGSQSAGAENPEHAIQSPEIVESDSLPRGSQKQNHSPGQNWELDRSKVDLYNAAVNGDWIKAERLLKADRQLARTDITGGAETALHVATGARQVDFVGRLLNLVPEPALLVLQDLNGNTPFCIAAAAGCIEIATIMLNKNPDLLEIRGAMDWTPLNMAVLLGNGEMAMVLYDRDTSYLTSEDLRDLFFGSITNDLYDFALKLLERTPELAWIRRFPIWETALHVLARKPTSIFNQEVKFTRKQESTSSSALQLINCILDVVKVDSDIKYFIREPSNLLFDAARSGNSFFLSELIHSSPHLVYELDEKRRTIFHTAILHRQLSVFDLINKIGFNKEIIATYVDCEGNSMLHLAAMLLYRPPETALSSAALEMQQEFKIFQMVEKLMQPALREAKNVHGLTPQELFAKEHVEMQKNGALWMNNTANSCSLVATLITTVTFAAGFTVPGGTDDKTGTPLLLKKPLFRVFATSNAIALSFSSFSVLMFSSIITSGYTQTQFLRSLPLRLMFGLLALFISIIFMMITFSSTYFLFYENGSHTIPTLTAALVSLPITLFVRLQYPLVRDIFRLTQRSGIPSRPGFLSKSDK